MSYKKLLPSITTFIFDIDGVLTDGGVNILTQESSRVINSRDGFALRFASEMGYSIFVISSGNSEALKNHLLKSGVKDVVLNSSNKYESYKDLKAKHHFSDHEVLYMGDDIPDYEVMKIIGVATCPQDAAVEIKTLSAYQSPYFGGRHCVRDVIEQTLRVQGKWFNPN